MWPHKPYVEEQTAPSFQRGGSLRQQPRGVLQYMSLKGGQTVHVPNRALQQQGIGTDRVRLQSPLAKQPELLRAAYGINPPSPNAAGVPYKQLLGPPSPNAARIPYKQLLGPSDKYSMYSRPPNSAGVRNEAVKPVKDAVRAFEKKK
jgi:hypothetical protein